NGASEHTRVEIFVENARHNFSVVRNGEEANPRAVGGRARLMNESLLTPHRSTYFSKRSQSNSPTTTAEFPSGPSDPKSAA
ncbi:MAG: hypothetical protein ABJB74_09960, partial [Gemmatimonas sp.]